MLKAEQFVLERSFSDLGSLQKAHTLRYGCVCGTETCQLWLAEGTRAESCCLHYLPETAKLLVRFLYENAVPMENWQEVVAELLTMLGDNNEITAAGAVKI